jgi:hypothetical protein
VYVDVDGVKQFISEKSTPVLKEASELKESTFEFANTQWASVVEQVSSNE